MEFFKLHSVRPQNLDNFTNFLSAAIDTFAANEQDPNFPLHLDSMIRNLSDTLLMATQELNVHQLVAKIYQVGFQTHNLMRTLKY